MTRTGWRLAATVTLAVAGAAKAAGPAITSFIPSEKRVVFKTSEATTARHTFRIEASTSLVAAAWTVQATACGFGAAASVTSPVTAGGPATFYRVVATSNATAFVDGAYLSIDLSGGKDANSYPVTHYFSLADVPGGANSDIYKTSRLLMRRIPKGTFTMGTRSTDYPGAFDAGLHQVTLTKDFYLGVFEVTQRQWELVMGSRPSYFNNAAYYATRPVEQVSYFMIREHTNNSAISPNWPETTAVHADSFMGRLRSKTGLPGLDLPTESQWEYACRAGTTAALNSGNNLTNTAGDAFMAEVGRYAFNGGSESSPASTTAFGSAAAGTYLPNAWGLYDMHGNVKEWCLDWYGSYPGAVSDPKGASSGSTRVCRGGRWVFHAYICTSSYRLYFDPGSISRYFGFRVYCSPADQP